MGINCSCIDFKFENDLSSSMLLDTIAKTAKNGIKSIEQKIKSDKRIQLSIILIQAIYRGKQFRKRCTQLKSSSKLISTTFETNYSFTDKNKIVIYSYNRFRLINKLLNC